MEKVESKKKLILFPGELLDDVQNYQRDLIKVRLESGDEDLNVPFTQVVLELIEEGLKRKKRKNK